jgi:ribosomal protein S18 acetylase RimI-like enzyme
MIRQATVEDSEAIAEIGRISFKNAHQGSSPDSYLDKFVEKHYHPSQIQQDILNSDHTYHIILCENSIVGFSKVVLNTSLHSLPGKPLAKLDRIYLLPAFQHKHYGQKLLDHILHICKENLQYGIWLYTWIGNERAIQFYIKYGFTIIDRYDYPIAENLSNPNHQMFLELKTGFK